MDKEELFIAKIVSGIKWSGAGQFLVNLLDFIVYVVLARLLFPEDFGLFAMATVFTGLVAVINQLGLEIAIIQRKEIEETHLSSTFWLILLFGIVLSLLVSGSAHVFAGHFDNPLVKPVLMALSLNFIISDLGFIHFAILQRRIDFHKIAIIESLTILIGGGASVLMAFSGLGVWSLVGGWLGQSLIRAGLSWYLCEWRPQVIFDFNSLKELFGFSKHIIGSRVSSLVSDNIIHLLIGKVLGEATLGIYSFAYKLSHIPAEKLTPIIERVALPAFSSIQEDNSTIRQLYQKKILYLSLISFPLLFGLVVTAPRFITVVYGNKWTGVIVPLQLFCAMGMVKCISYTAGTILRSKGSPDKEFRWTLATAVIFPLSILVGLKYGIVGVCIALTVATSSLYFIIQLIANATILLSPKQFFSNLSPAVFLSGLMVLGMVVYEYGLGYIFPRANLLGLAIPVLIGFVCYLGMFSFFYRNIYIQIKQVITQSLARVIRN